MAGRRNTRDLQGCANVLFYPCASFYGFTQHVEIEMQNFGFNYKTFSWYSIYNKIMIER